MNKETSIEGIEKTVKISIVVPVYKEEANIKPFLERIIPVVSEKNWDYEILFCLDPSPDNTYTIIKQYNEHNPRIKVIQFSRRFGQPAATMAGILNCGGEICIIIDVDLQDPPELIPKMVEKWKEGYNVVYAQRVSRDGESLFKKAVAWLGYKLINNMSEIEIPVNTGDFRLIDRKIIEELRKLNENHGFLRGLVAFVGMDQVAIQYNRDARYSGKGNYNRFIGSLKIGLNGLFCFSSKPLQIMSGIGFAFAGVGFLLGIWYIIQKAFLQVELTPGLSTTVVLITFFAGIQLFFLGIIGEYISRIYDEVKHRPMFIIDEDKTIFKEDRGHE